MTRSTSRATRICSAVGCSTPDIAYVQFADALAPESHRLVRETLHRRTVPGEGALELDRFATTLLERGYDSIVSVEVLSSALRGQPIDVLVGCLHDTTVPFWSGRSRGLPSHANERDAGRHAR